MTYLYVISYNNNNFFKFKMLFGMSKLCLKGNDVNSWVERFELYNNLNEINTHTQKLMFLTLLGNDGTNLNKKYLNLNTRPMYVFLMNLQNLVIKSLKSCYRVILIHNRT